MMCSTIISRLGYECLPIGEESLRIISPFPYCDDGEHVGAFVQQINGIYKVTDRCDALMNMEARGFPLIKVGWIHFANFFLARVLSLMKEVKSLSGHKTKMNLARSHQTLSVLESLLQQCLSIGIHLSSPNVLKQMLLIFCLKAHFLA